MAYTSQLNLYEHLNEPPAPAPDGRDDMNLVELLLGVARSTRTTNKPTQTPWAKGERSYDVTITDHSYKIEWQAVAKENNKTVRKNFYLSVDASVGLPSPYVEDVLIALLKLSSSDGQLQPQVRTTRYNLIKLMRWPGTGKYYYDRLERTLDEMASLTVRTNSLWNPDSKSYWKFTFNLLDSSLMDLDPDNPNSEIVITWAPTALRLLALGYTKPLDTRFYYSLDDPTTRRLYRWLDKQFRVRPTIEIDVLSLAHRVLGYGINWAYPSKVIQKLAPKLRKLEEQSYCTCTVKRSQTDSGKKYVFQRITPYLSVVHPSNSNIRAALSARGFDDNEAHDLIARFGSWQCLRQIEHYEFKLLQGASVASPRAWIKSAIGYKNGHGYKIPDALMKRLAQATAATIRWCKEYYAMMHPNDQRALNETALAQLPPEQQHALSQQDEKAAAAFQRLRNHLLLNQSHMPSAPPSSDIL